MLDERIRRNITRACRTGIYGDLYAHVDDYVQIDDIPFLEEHHIRDAMGSLGINEQSSGGFIYHSGGTTGLPKRLFYTLDDFDRVGQRLAKFNEVEGLRESKRVLVFMDQFFWPVGHYTALGHRMANDIVIPVDTDLSRHAVAGIVSASQPEVISSLPSVLMKFREQLRCESLQLIEATGEPLLPEVREELEAFLGVQVLDSYGLTEGVVGVECPIANGFHFFPEDCLVEIIDEEVVLTHFDYELLPITRYRTGDMGWIETECCDCSSTLPRLKIAGRIRQTLGFFEGFQIEKQALENRVTDLVGCECFEILNYEPIEKVLSCRIEPEYPDAIKRIEVALGNTSMELLELVRQGELRVRVIS